jgi:hypothetical protein
MAITTSCELRRAAAEVIRQRGWTQRRLENGPGGPVCLLGAMAVALGLPLRGYGALNMNALAQATLAEMGFAGYVRTLEEMGFAPDPDSSEPGNIRVCAAGWNDHLPADTGAAQVIARLLRGCEEA